MVSFIKKTQRLLICPYSHRDERGCALLGASTLARNNALAWADSNYCCHLFVHLSREIISLQLFLSLLSRSDPAIAQTRRKECARGFSRIFQTPSISYGCWSRGEHPLFVASGSKDLGGGGGPMVFRGKGKGGQSSLTEYKGGGL